MVRKAKEKSVREMVRESLAEKTVYEEKLRSGHQTTDQSASREVFLDVGEARDITI